ncbi:MAG: iron uptake porin [Leptolyngbya sp. BL-A-14]
MKYLVKNMGRSLIFVSPVLLAIELIGILPAIAVPSSSAMTESRSTESPSNALPQRQFNSLTSQAAVPSFSQATTPQRLAQTSAPKSLATSDLADGDPMDQVTSISQLTDVKPTDWAFQALQSMVERYGCLVGYPDRTYRGNRALSRYEFAAGLSACMDRVNELINAGTADLVKREDVLTLQRLQEEFATELATVRGRVGELEARSATLEKQQFSTTIKLVGQLITSVSDTFGNRVGGRSDQSQTYFADRARLNLEGSFTGRDFLRVRLEFGNFLRSDFSSAIASVTGTNNTRLNFDTDTGNRLAIPHLLYRFPVGDSVSITVGPTGVGFTDITSTITPPSIADDGMGIPSVFGEYSPFYRQGGGGGAINWNITNDLVLTVGYLAIDANVPNSKNGLFNGGYSAMAQLAYTGNWGGIGVSYAHLYNRAGRIGLSGGAGSFLAEQPFGDGIATSGDSFGLSGFYKAARHFNIHGWGGYIKASAENSAFSNVSNGRGGTNTFFVSDNANADIFYGALGLTFPDVGGTGNLPGILVGIPPKVTSGSVRSDRSTPVHVEAFYRWQITDNIGITPGFWVIFNPENDSRNDTQFVGVLRTYFSF